MAIRDIRRVVDAVEELDAIRRARSCAPVVADPAWSINEDEIAPLVLRWPSIYAWPRAKTWAEPLRAALMRRIRVEKAAIPQRGVGLVIGELRDGARAHHIVIDYSDHDAIDEAEAHRAVVYFKMQHRREGYDIPSVVPGGYVSDTPIVYRYLPYLRALRDGADFEYDVYGRFSLRFAAETRSAALSRLQSQTRFRFEGSGQTIGRAAFLKQLTRAKVSLDLPGNGAFCHRLVNGLAIGACIVGPEPGNVLPGELVNGVHVVWTQPDLSDLVDRCAHLVEHDEERERIAAAARLWFDRHLHPDSLATFYLRTIVDRLELLEGQPSGGF